MPTMKIPFGMMKNHPAMLLLLLLLGRRTTQAGYLKSDLCLHVKQQQLLAVSSINNVVVGTASALYSSTVSRGGLEQQQQQREGLQYPSPGDYSRHPGGYSYEKHGNIVVGGAGMDDLTLVNNIEELSREWKALNAEKHNEAASTAPYAMRQQPQQQQQQVSASASPKDALNHERAVVDIEKLAREWAALNREHDSISSTTSTTTTTPSYKPPPLWSWPVTPASDNIASKQHAAVATPTSMQELAQQWTAMNRDHDNRHRHSSSSSFSSSSYGSSVFQKSTTQSSHSPTTRPVMPVTAVPSSSVSPASTPSTSTPRPSMSAAELAHEWAARNKPSMSATELAREWTARNKERHEQPLHRSSRAVVGGVNDSSTSSWSSRTINSYHSAPPPPPRGVDTTTSVFQKKTAVVFPPMDVAALAREWASVNRDHNTKQFMPPPEAFSAFSSSTTASTKSAKTDVTTVPMESPINNDAKQTPPPPLPRTENTFVTQPSAVAARAKKVEVWATKTIEEISADSAKTKKDNVTHKQLEIREFQKLAAIALELQKVDEEIQMLRKMAAVAKSEPPQPSKTVMMQQPPELCVDDNDEPQLDNLNIVAVPPEDGKSFTVTASPPPPPMNAEKTPKPQQYVGLTDPPAESSDDLPDWVLASLDSVQFDDENNDDQSVLPMTNADVFIAPPPLSPPPAMDSKKTTSSNEQSDLIMMTGAADFTAATSHPAANTNTNVPDWVVAPPALLFPGVNNNGPPPLEEKDENVVDHENSVASAAAAAASDIMTDFQPTDPTIVNTKKYALPDWLLDPSTDPKKATCSVAASPGIIRISSATAPKSTLSSYVSGGSSPTPSWVTDSPSSYGGSSSFAPSWVTGSQSSLKDKNSPPAYGWTSPAPLASDVINSLAPQVASDPVATTTTNHSSNTYKEGTSTKSGLKSRNGSIFSKTRSPVFPPAITAARSISSSGNVPDWVTAGSSLAIMNEEMPMLEGWTTPTTPSDHANDMIASLNNVVLNSNDNDDDFATLSFASPARKALSRPIDVASSVFASPPRAKVNLRGSKAISGYSAPSASSSTSSAVPSWVTAIDINNYVDVSLAGVEPDPISSLTAVEAVTFAFTSQAAKEWAVKNRNEKNGNAKVAALIQELDELDADMQMKKMENSMRKAENFRPIQPLVLTARPRRDITALEAISSAFAFRNSRDWAVVNRRDPVVTSRQPRDVTALEAISSASNAKNSREWAASIRRYPVVTAREPRDITALEAISFASTAKSSREWAVSNRRDSVNPSVATPHAVLPRDVTASHAVSFASAAKLAGEWTKRKLNSKLNFATSQSVLASPTSTPKSDVPPSTTATSPAKTRISRPTEPKPRLASSSKEASYTSLTAKAFMAWAASRDGTSEDDVSVAASDPKPRDVTLAEAVSFASAAKNSRAWAHLNRKDHISATMCPCPKPTDPKPTAEAGSFSIASQDIHSLVDDESIAAFFFEFSDEFKHHITASVAAHETLKPETITKVPVLFKATPVTEQKTTKKLESVAAIAKKMEKYMLEPPKLWTLPKSKKGASFPTNFLKDKEEMTLSIMAGGIVSMFAVTIAVESLFEQTMASLSTRAEMGFATALLEIVVQNEEGMSFDKKEQSITSPSASSLLGEFTKSDVFVSRLLNGRFDTIEEKAFVPRLLHDDTLWG